MPTRWRESVRENDHVSGDQILYILTEERTKNGSDWIVLKTFFFSEAANLGSLFFIGLIKLETL